MAELIEERDTLKNEPRNVLGLDASYSGKLVSAAAVLYNIAKKRVEQYSVAIMRVKLPYVPGFLGFREIPAFMAALKQIDLNSVDLIIVDGHGRFHPRMAGSASHISLAVGKPTIGVAKSALKADRIDNKIIYMRGRPVGMILDEPEGSRKLYVSVGGGLSLERSYYLIKKLRKGKGLPSPLEFADQLSRRALKDALSGG
ncbi:MAG: endonuclease V [Fervidicoccaceae archaeon]